MNDSDAQKMEQLANEQTGGAREYDIIALTAAASLAGQSLQELAQFDHSNPPTAASELQKRNNAVNSLQMVHDFLIDSESESDDTDRKRTRENNLRIIDDTVKGYTYRQEHHLAGVANQISSLRDDMSHNRVEKAQTEMLHLMQQPDIGEDMLAQLRGEYRLVQDLLEEGVVPDAHDLFMKTYSVTGGLDSASIPECINRLFDSAEIEMQMQKAKPLILMQDVHADIYSLTEAAQHIPEVQRAIVHRVAKELQFRRSIYVGRITHSHVSEKLSKNSEEMHASPEDEVSFEMKRMYEAMHEDASMPTDTEGWKKWYEGHVSRQIALVSDIQKATTELDRLQHGKTTWKEKMGLKKKIDSQRNHLHALRQLNFEEGERIDAARYLVQAHTFMETRIQMIQAKMSHAEK